MKRKSVQRHVADLPRGGQRAVVELRLEQVRPDPNQPRRFFDPDKLRELAESIKSQELQQFPTVNYAFDEQGVPIYFIKAGERRYHAHHLLKKETIWVIIDPEVYTGKPDPTRVLAQAAENSSREPHTHAEIITVMRMVIEEEREKRGEKTYGLYEIALGKVATAFGKSRAWALNYRVLVDLHPDLVQLLDEEDPDKKLNFGVACSLARLPYDHQMELLGQANGLKQKGGAKLMLRFITKQADALRGTRSEGRGRRRVPSDDKKVFLNTARSLHRVAMHLVAERKTSEYHAYVNYILGQMGAIEIDQLMGDLNQALVTFNEFAAMVSQRREVLYTKFK